MDKELKEKWVKALRSGEYEQLRRGFHDGGKHCCLAVLSEAAGRRDDLLLYPCFDGCPSNDERTALIKMNDSGATFAEIADYIEANL